MDEKDFNDILTSSTNLNKKFGNSKSVRFVLFSLIIIILVAIVLLIIKLNIKRRISKEFFALDSSSKYLISTDSSQNTIYYEIDFSEGQIVTRHDTNAFKREELSRNQINSKKLEQFLITITKDPNNLFITDEEMDHLKVQNCNYTYKIKNSTQKTFYIKDANKIKYLSQLLSEYTNY